MKIITQKPRPITTAKQILPDQQVTVDTGVNKFCVQLVSGVYAQLEPQLVQFLRSMGLSVQAMPPGSKVKRVKESSKTATQPQFWYSLSVASDKLDCTVEVGVLYNVESQRIEACNYSIEAGKGVPAFTLLPADSGLPKWMYSETVNKSFQTGIEDLPGKIAGTLQRAIKKDMQDFRAQIEEYLRASKDSTIQLLRVGGYSL